MSLGRGIVLTGCTGTVGMALMKCMTERKIPFLALVNPDSSRNQRLEKKGYPFFPLPMNFTEEEGEKAAEEIRRRLGRPYAVIHLAWRGTLGEARQDLRMQMENVEDTMRLLRLMHTVGAEVFVGAGSQAELGPVEGDIAPRVYCDPDTGYGAAKRSAYLFTKLLASQLGMRQSWVRIVSIYGPYDGENTMVQSALRAWLRGENPAFTRGDQMWDYLYSEDAAEAFLGVAEKGKHGAVYCLGSGETRPLREYIALMHEAAAPDKVLRLGERPYYPNQVHHLRADSRTLMEDTGFQVRTPFREGIRRTIEAILEEEV